MNSQTENLGGEIGQEVGSYVGTKIGDHYGGPALGHPEERSVASLARLQVIGLAMKSAPTPTTSSNYIN